MEKQREKDLKELQRKTEREEKGKCHMTFFCLRFDYHKLLSFNTYFVHISEEQRKREKEERELQKKREREEKGSSITYRFCFYLNTIKKSYLSQFLIFDELYCITVC